MYCPVGFSVEYFLDKVYWCQTLARLELMNCCICFVLSTSVEISYKANICLVVDHYLVTDHHLVADFNFPPPLELDTHNIGSQALDLGVHLTSKKYIPWNSESSHLLIRLLS